MILQERTVTVKQLPETLPGRQRRAFFEAITSCLDFDRPCLVLDCSKLLQIDKQTVHLLLCCLEEAMKRNGDVRLSGVSFSVKVALEAADAAVLFRFFETNDDAIASFARRAAVRSPVKATGTTLLHNAENVA
jgi:anti-anti-sigma regulatory factor